MAFVVVRVRGTIHARRDIVETLRFLHLTRANHATVVPEAPPVRGMLFKVQGYVTWGEAEPETLGLLLKERGRGPDGHPLSGGGEGVGAETVDLAALSRAVADGGLSGVKGVRPLFRLKAPKGGWRSTKRPYTLGGALGYRGRAINDLVRRMV
ncbi:MAG TPA: 50S ribosomal protein L30 [Thermoplasmata archaeon]|nr:50S ribosomal protein L30 [Thermoplasmata archaeon]